MANNTYSLSWFKKRTALINRQLGDKAYSPTVEYRKYLDSTHTGRQTRFISLYGGTSDYRSQRGVQQITQKATTDLVMRWEGFANANILAGAIWRWVGYPDAYIDPKTAHVWVAVNDVNDKGEPVTKWVRGYPEYLQPKNPDSTYEEPSGLVKLTNRSATNALIKISEKVKSRTSRGASGNIGDAVGGYLREEL